MTDPVSPISALAREALNAARASASVGASDQTPGSLGVDSIGETFEEKARMLLERMEGISEASARGLGAGQQTTQTVPGTAAPGTPAPAAGDMMARVLQEIDEPIQAAGNLPIDILRGRVTSPAEIAATMKRADLTFRYSLEIRNRLLDAYREVMRMGV